MKKVQLTLIYTLLTLLILAAYTNAGNLAGRSRVELGGGLYLDGERSTAEIYWDGDHTELALGSSLGSISLSHWQNRGLAVGVTYSVLDYDDYYFYGPFDYQGTEQSELHSILFNLRFYARQPNRFTSWHPFVSVGVGPYIGHVREDVVGVVPWAIVTENRTEAVMGARFGGGIDIELSRHFMFGINGGYNLVGDFSEPVNGELNHSGADFGFSFSLLVGGRGR